MKLKQFCFAMTITVLMCVTTAYAQTDARGPTPETTTGSDAYGFRKDKITKESIGERNNTPRSPSVKQTMEDFRQLQELNYKLRDQAKISPLALEEIAETAKKINSIAGKLKTNLALPKAKDKTEIAPVESSDALVGQIAEINASVKAFVTNPIFRNTTDSKNDLPVDASVNLNKVIELSKALEQGATRLNRVSQKK